MIRLQFTVADVRSAIGRGTINQTEIVGIAMSAIMAITPEYFAEQRAFFQEHPDCLPASQISRAMATLDVLRDAKQRLQSLAAESEATP